MNFHQLTSKEDIRVVAVRLEAIHLCVSSNTNSIVVKVVTVVSKY